MDRREHSTPGRRSDDPDQIEEKTWQEACGHDRKVIHLLQEGYARFTRWTIGALVIMAVLLGIALWRDFVLGSENSQRIKDIHISRLIDVEQRCFQSNKANADLVVFLYKITPAKQRKAQPHFARQVQGFSDAINPVHKNCIAYANEVVNTTTPPKRSGIKAKHK